MMFIHSRLSENLITSNQKHKFFMNMTKEYDLSGDNGVKKIILHKGIKSNEKINGSIVTIHYVGFLENGDIFDSSYKRKEPYSFELYKGNVIEGWDIGIHSMELCEKSRFTIMPKYGYKKKGIPPIIPPNAKLFFEIELLKIESVKKNNEKPYNIQQFSKNKQNSNINNDFFFISPFRSQTGKNAFQGFVVVGVFMVLFFTFWIIVYTGNIHTGYSIKY